MILAIFDLQSPKCFLPSFESTGLLVQEKKRKIDFQDGGHGGHLGFPIGMILAIFDLQVTPMLPTKYQDFQDGCHGAHPGFTIGTILAIFDLQVTPMLPSKFGVNWPFDSGEEAKNRFSRWQPWRPSWISDRHYFSSFLSISHPNASYQVWSQLAFGFRSRSKISRWRPRRPSWNSDRHDFSYF